MTNDSELFHAIFYPKSIAVVGATDNPLKGGYRRFNALLGHFGDNLYPVNPNETKVGNLKSYSSVKDIPCEIDQVVVSIPSPAVPQIVQDCVDKGVKVVSIFTSGYSEFGPEGKIKEDELLSIAHRGNTRIIGPNCIGIYCPKGGLSFYQNLPKRDGDIAFIAQSGGMAVTFVQLGSTYGLGFSKVVSFGNGADIDCTDYFEYLADDDDTKIVAAYLEGVRDGSRFKKAVQRLAKKKPVVIWKVGKTAMGARAISSHTGALSGEDKIWDALLKQNGIIRVGNLDEMIDTLILLKRAPEVDKRLAIITIGGGAGVAAADLCAEMGLEIARFSDKSITELSKWVPGAGTSVKNPIDLAAYGLNGETLQNVIRIAAEDDAVDTVMMLGLIDSTSQLIRGETEKIIQGLKKPFVMVGPVISENSVQAHREISKKGIPIFSSEIRAGRAIINLVRIR